MSNTYPNLDGFSHPLLDDNFVVKYMLKHHRECYMKNKVQGTWPITLFFIQHELGNALNDLWNFIVM